MRRDHLDALLAEPLIGRIAVVCLVANQVLGSIIDYFSPEKVDALNQERMCFVAEDGGEIVGTGALEGEELVTFFVSPERQRSGIGSALLSAVEKAASDCGLQQLRVGASLAGAPFYQRCGYEPTGEILEGTAGSHVAMRKVLT